MIVHCVFYLRYKAMYISLTIQQIHMHTCALSQRFFLYTLLVNRIMSISKTLIKRLILTTVNAKSSQNLDKHPNWFETLFKRETDWLPI